MTDKKFPPDGYKTIEEVWQLVKARGLGIGRFFVVEAFNIFAPRGAGKKVEGQESDIREIWTFQFDDDEGKEHTITAVKVRDDRGTGKRLLDESTIEAFFAFLEHKYIEKEPEPEIVEEKEVVSAQEEKILPRAPHSFTSITLAKDKLRVVHGYHVPLSKLRAVCADILKLDNTELIESRKDGAEDLEVHIDSSYYPPIKVVEASNKIGRNEIFIDRSSLDGLVKLLRDKGIGKEAKDWEDNRGGGGLYPRSR